MSWNFSSFRLCLNEQMLRVFLLSTLCLICFIFVLSLFSLFLCCLWHTACVFFPLYFLTFYFNEFFFYKLFQWSFTGQMKRLALFEFKFYSFIYIFPFDVLDPKKSLALLPHVVFLAYILVNRNLLSKKSFLWS